MLKVTFAVFCIFATTINSPVHCTETTAETVDHKIQRHLGTWDYYKKAWAAEAEIVVLAKYNRSSYPCIFLDQGFAMPMRSVFHVEDIIKGNFIREDFDANLVELDEKRFPRDFVSGRKYIVFLKPGKESKLLLNDPKKSFCIETQMSPKELVAIIDVSKSKVEADSEKVSAHKTGRHGKFDFTKRKWERMRKSSNIDLTAQSAFIPFIMNTVLPDEATVAHVRSYLGEPDYRHMNTDGIYYEYRLNTAAPTVLPLHHLFWSFDDLLRSSFLQQR